MVTCRSVGIWALLLLAAGLPVAGQDRTPDVGYLYPAGGRAGSEVYVLVGGQFLRGVNQVVISGQGVRGEVVKAYRPLRNLDKSQRQLLKRRMRLAADARWAELQQSGQVKGAAPWSRQPVPAAPEAGVTLPSHPKLDRIEQMRFDELQHLQYLMINRRGLQQNNQIAELAVLRIRIDADAPVGTYRLRLVGPLGISNAMFFQVDPAAEVVELEPNDPKAKRIGPLFPVVEPPAIINGQIMPGDVDCFRFHGRAGQRLHVQVRARRLIRFLADAVPGWFQAVVSIHDASGRELVYADDDMFDPDPSLIFEVPADGEYELRIRDALYRGREDFVYRIAIGESPMVDRMVRLGGVTGRPAIDSRGPGGTDLPVVREDDARTPSGQPVSLPVVIAGQIGRADERDVYRFTGRAGQTVIAEVTARRLGSPLDAVCWLLDDSGHVISWADDTVDKAGHVHRGIGSQTHFADARLQAKLPADGTYRLMLGDAARHGGAGYGYRLRLSEPKPAFQVYLSPGAISGAPGREVPITVHVLRRDGFDGPLTLSLQGDSHQFRLSGGRVAAGRQQAVMTLRMPLRPLKRVMPLQLVATATIDGRQVTRPVEGAEVQMQAFLWEHLVPTGPVLVADARGRRVQTDFQGVPAEGVRLSRGGSEALTVQVPQYDGKMKLELVPLNVPAGLTVSDAACDRRLIRFTLQAADDAGLKGYRDNVLIQLYAHLPVRVDGKVTGRTRRMYFGVLPALPVEVVD